MKGARWVINNAWIAAVRLRMPSGALRFQRERESEPHFCVCAETEQREEKGEMVTASLEWELAAGSVFNVLNLQGVCGRVDFKFPGD